MSDLKYWIALSQIQQLGPQRFKKLISAFPNMEEVWRVSLQDLLRAGIEENIAQEVVSRKTEINPDEELAKVEKENIKVITINDINYPPLLQQISNPPPLLYVKGRLDKTDEFTIAVIGTRKITMYGSEATEKIVTGLVKNGITIVSGLALGVDAKAQETAVGLGGRTIGVLGTGIDEKSVYPSTNRFLAKKILENDGAIISEFPLGTLPFKSNFPMRNRIISGLSLGVLVIEAAENSGSLITANIALEQNREVFAVPGSIFSNTSSGTNNLLRLGAKLVTDASDILETLNLQQAINYTEAKKIIADSPEEEKLLKYLSYEPLLVDELIKKAGLSASDALSAITLMEIKGKIKNLGGGNYVLSR